MDVEKYIVENGLEGKKIADVLRDWDLGLHDLGHICNFYGYSIDLAMGHIYTIDGYQYLPGIGYRQKPVRSNKF